MDGEKNDDWLGVRKDREIAFILFTCKHQHESQGHTQAVRPCGAPPPLGLI